MNLRSLSTYFTLDRNFYDSLESLSRSSTLAFKFDVFISNFIILSLWMLVSYSNFLISAALCLLSSSNSLNRLSKTIILPSIFETAALVIFLNWLIYSVKESCFLVISYNSLSTPYLYCLKSCTLCMTSLSNLISRLFNCFIFPSYTSIIASIFLIFPSF